MEGFLNPSQVLKHLKLRKDMVACDFGSGSGGWVLPLAKKLAEGKVYAIDILREPLSALQGKANLEKLSNIITIQSDLESKAGLKLEDSTSDLVLMTNLLFQVENKKSVLEEGKRVLKKRGKILIVDWDEDSPLGPEEGRASLEEVEKIASQLDLEPEKEFRAGKYHWGLILEKK